MNTLISALPVPADMQSGAITSSTFSLHDPSQRPGEFSMLLAGLHLADDEDSVMEETRDDDPLLLPATALDIAATAAAIRNDMTHAARGAPTAVAVAVTGPADGQPERPVAINAATLPAVRSAAPQANDDTGPTSRIGPDVVAGFGLDLMAPADPSPRTPASGGLPVVAVGKYPVAVGTARSSAGASYSPATEAEPPGASNTTPAGSLTAPDSLQIASAEARLNAASTGMHLREVTQMTGNASDRVLNLAPQAPPSIGINLAMQASLTGTEPGIPGPSGQVATPLHSPQWQAELGRQFIMLARSAGGQSHTAELRLDPPELGPLRITLTVSDHIASASFVSGHAIVRNAVEQAIPALQQSMAQAGLALGQAHVGDQAGSHKEPGNSSQQPQAQSRPGQGPAQADSKAANAGQAQVTTAVSTLVDTFA